MLIFPAVPKEQANYTIGLTVVCLKMQFSCSVLVGEINEEREIFTLSESTNANGQLLYM